MAIFLAGCANPHYSKLKNEAFINASNQKVVFLCSTLIPEQEVVVYIGECHSRKLHALEEKIDELISSGTSSEKTETRKEEMQIWPEREAERRQAVHVRVFVNSVSLCDKTVVPDLNLGFTAVSSFQTNSRYVLRRVEFPDDGDSKEAIVDISRGRFLNFSRYGSNITLEQGKVKWLFM